MYAKLVWSSLNGPRREKICLRILRTTKALEGIIYKLATSEISIF